LFFESASCVTGSATSRLEVCLQQICDSTYSASSPSVQRAGVDILTLKECEDKLKEFLDFNEDPNLWAQGYNISGGATQLAMFTACQDNLRCHWIAQKLNRVQRAELGASNWFAHAP